MPLIAPLVTTPPHVPPPVPVQRFFGLSVSWTGWDGSVWPMSQPQSGLFLTDGGIKGLSMPAFERWTSTSPALPGSRYLGSRATEREVFWPLFVYSNASSAEWLARDRAFWATLRPDEVGTWTVTDPDGFSRSLTCRFSEVDDSFAKDPVLAGWNLYGITLVAEQPYWSGDLVYRSFANDPPTEFFGADHSPVPVSDLLFISSGSTPANAEIDNPGDVDAYSVMVMDGPQTSGASVGVGSGITVYNADIADGKSVIFDTRPGMRRVEEIATPAFDGGTDEWWAAVSVPGVGTSKVSSVDPDQFALNAAIPRGADVPLAIDPTGAGTVHVALEPAYHRAW